MITNRSKITDQELVKYISGVASETEQNHVETWIGQNEENKKYYLDLKLIWSQSKNEQIKSTISEEEAWARFKTRTLVAKTASGPELLGYKWLRIAAALTILLIAGQLVFHMVSALGKTRLISGKTVTTVPVKPLYLQTTVATAHIENQATAQVRDTGNEKRHDQRLAKNHMGRSLRKKPQNRRSLFSNVSGKRDSKIAPQGLDLCLDNFKYHGPKYDSNF